MSPVYYNDPARWYADENQRRDEQMRGLLNMVMAAKKFKYDQGQDEWSRDLQERQLGEQTRRNDVYEANQSERVQYPPEYIMKIQHPELFPEKEAAPGSLEKDVEYLRRLYPDLSYDELLKKHISIGQQRGAGQRPQAWSDVATGFTKKISDKLTPVRAKAASLESRAAALRLEVAEIPEGMTGHAASHRNAMQQEVDALEAEALAMRAHEAELGGILGEVQSGSEVSADLIGRAVEALKKPLGEAAPAGAPAAGVSEPVIPPEVLKAAKAKYPDVSEGEIIRRWLNSKKK